MSKYIIASVTTLGIVVVVGVAILFGVDHGSEHSTDSIGPRQGYGIVVEGRRVLSADKKRAQAVRTLKRAAEIRPLKEPDDVYRITDPQVSEAIRVCREARILEAIPALVQLADVPDQTAGLRIMRETPEEDWPPWLIGVSPSPPHLVYPAATALVTIGGECVPELLKALAKELPSSRQAWILRSVLVHILGPEGARKIVAEKVSQLGDKSARERLVGHLEKLRRVSGSRVFEDEAKDK